MWEEADKPIDYLTIRRIRLAKTANFRLSVVFGRKIAMAVDDRIKCPACDGVIDADEEEIDEGDSISCDECGAVLKVLSTDPLELESAEEVEEEEEEDDEFPEEEEEEAEEEWH
jgi:alpha-aminoadipate/glutamate carrier protein LysW